MTTLEKWKDKLVGETFSRLTVIDVLPYFTKDGKPKGYKAKCKCSCGNITETAISNIINGHTKSCGCLIIEASKETIKIANKKAQEWQKEHPEEVKEITKKRLEGKKLWMLHHREEYLLSCQKRRLSLCSKEERDILNFLTSLKYPIERQYLVEGHSYDFKVGKFLIEYHGSFYHCSEYTNLNNPESNVSPKRYKSITYHQQLREVAIRNGFKLIQIWDYLDEERLLNNDYGFIIDGQQVEPRGIWVSSSTHKQIVDESYNKGKFLVYNSGYTSYRLEDC